MAKVKDLLVNGSSRFIGKIYASDQFISQVANGTAPFVVSSSTVVANLNADMTDGLHVHTGRNNEVNKIVRTDGSGYIQTGYINTNVGTDNLAISRIFYEYNNDGYIRKMSPSSFFSVLENSGNDISITVAGQNRKLTVGYASNADKLGGVHYQNILERINTGYSESGTATGWFRIAETLTTDGAGITFLLAIQRNYNYTNNESYLFSISISYNGGISITQLSGYANSRLITKIRVDWSNSQIAYIDLYINASYTNNGYYWYTVGCAKSYTAWTANPTLVGHAYEFTTVQGCKSDRGFTGDLTGTASKATDADTLDGYHATYGINKPWGTIPVITNGGYMDVGKHFEFHYDNTTGSDYSTVLGCTGNYSNIVSLPSKSGTLALLTDNVASASKWATPRTITLTGSVTGSVSIDGSQNVSLATTTNHTHTFASLTSKPTTISGYGITDAYTKTQTDTKLSGYLPLSGGILTGSITMQGMDTNLIRDIVYDGSSGWARGLITLRVDGVDKFSIAAFGSYTAGASDNGIYYGYIGCNDYDGLNLRISAASLSWGTNPILHSGNYNSYSPKLDGTGATGTWGISISGTADSASYAATLIAISKPTTDTVKYDKPFSYFVGQPKIGTAEGNAYAGSSSNYNLLSFPPEGTTYNSEYANVMTLRLSWDKSKYWHDIFASPNTQFLWHRRVYYGTAYDWYRIVEETTDRTWGINISGNAATATNADTLDGYHASNLVKFYLSPMASGAPADSATSWFVNTMPAGTGAIVYNVPGSEKTIIAGKSTGPHGHMLQLNYDDNYLRILRYRSGSWITNDWEKISAGYADAAGNADTLDGYHATSGSNQPWGTIPVITPQGWMDVGRQFEFHYDNTTGSDYSTMLRCTGNYSNAVYLPSASGTLALTTDNVASSTQSLLLSNTSDAKAVIGIYFHRNNGDTSLVGNTEGDGVWGHPGDSQDAPFGNASILRIGWSSNYYTDIFTGPNNASGKYGLQWRQIVNGTANSWKILLDSSNYNYYAPTLTGTGASGTWGINISGNAANADTLDGYHASSFYKLKPIRSDQDSIYDLRYNYGTYDKGDYHGTYKDEYPTNYGAYLALTYNDKNTGALMFFDTSTSNVLGHIYVRTRTSGDWNTTYSEWGTLAYLTDNVASASKWATPRTITLTGSVTGSVSIDGSQNVSLATTTNHTHNYAGSSSAGGSANSALTLLYNNKFDTTYGDYAIFQQSYNISDFPHSGWFNSIKMLHNNSTGYFTEIAMSFTGEDGMWRRALRGGGQVGWYKILDSGNYNSYSPKLDGTGATGTWGINISGNAATATNAENISSIYPQLAASLEADEINVKRQIAWNNWGDYGYTLEAAIDFNWYETHNLFGVIRGNNTDSAGFGWMYSPDGSTYTPIARLSPSGQLYLASSLTISGAISGVTDITASGHAKVNSLKTQYICIECDNSGNTAGRSSEINNYAGPLYIQHNTSNNCFICSGGGNVGIGTAGPSYKLHVVGDIYTTTGFKKEGSSDSYVLLGGGGHKAISDFATASHTHSNYIERLAWWNDGDSHNANDLLSGTTFAYHNHSNCPTTGTIVAFNCINSTGYPLQLQGSYYGEDLWFRNRNGDNGTWNAWRYIIHNGNIGSQSVNYASSAGNADTVDNLHASNFVKFYLSPMDSGAPASSAKSWFTDTMPSSSGAIVYNVPGSEKTIIAGKSTGAHGHMLQLNYDDNYLRILRYFAGNWKSDDWEKISAGYADSAGNADTLDGYHAYSFQVISSTTASSVSSLYCGSYSSYHVTTSSSATMTFANTPDSGKECHIIIYNSGSSTITITLPSGYRRNIDSITIASGAFGEVNVLNAAGTIYVRAV